MPTIFDNVVRNENDHTNLLRNLMVRHPGIAACVLQSLTKRDISELHAASFEIGTQKSFSGAEGREIPDIVVEGSAFRCLIEAKIDPALPLTPNQAKGYQSCFTPDADCHLVFLVPREWKHRAVAENVQTLLPRVSVWIFSWQDLVVI